MSSLCYLVSRTFFRIALDVFCVEGCLSLEWGWGVVAGANKVIGDKGAPDMRMGEFLWSLVPPEGMDTCLGAVNGLYVSFWACFWRWTSLAMSSAGSFMTGGAGVDSVSKNFTNNSENDCKTQQQINYLLFKKDLSMFLSKVTDKQNNVLKV